MEHWRGQSQYILTAHICAAIHHKTNSTVHYQWWSGAIVARSLCVNRSIAAKGKVSVTKYLVYLLFFCCGLAIVPTPTVDLQLELDLLHFAL